MVQPILAVAGRPVEHSSDCERDQLTRARSGLIERLSDRLDSLRTSVGDASTPRYATWRSVLGRFRLEGNLDLDVTASRRGSNGGGDPIGMPPNERPLGATRQHDEGDTAGSQVLLVANATVGRQQQLEAGFLGGVQQRAVI